MPLFPIDMSGTRRLCPNTLTFSKDMTFPKSLKALIMRNEGSDVQSLFLSFVDISAEEEFRNGETRT